MPTVLQFRRGTTSQNNSFTGSAGEISVDTETNQLRIHDGSTAGGFVISGGESGGGGTAWQTVKTSSFTAVAGEGYFVDTTSGLITVTLPASPTQGDEVSIIDYSGTADTNTITVGRNGSNIAGVAEDLIVAVERAAFTLVYADSTQGWLLNNK